eukprot:jgi/Tetstr1/453936/TSEL_040855.t1
MNPPGYSYSEKRLYPADGVFDALAASCVLLVTSKRLERATSQIDRDRPHSRVTVQLNYGMKYKTDLVEQTTRADICHALMTAFRRSLALGHARVLVLEDDFFLGTEEDILQARAAVPRIARFLNGREFDTYNVGRLVFTGWPVGGGSWRALAHSTAHGVLYSARYMRRYIAQHDRDPRPIIKVGNDRWWNRLDILNYVYTKPLIFQTFPKTDNRQTWDGGIVSFGIDRLGLDDSHQPGYRVLDGISKSLLFVALIALILIVSGVVWASVRLRRRM